MQRKLIKQGGGGYTIYLPKKWLDKKGLKSGDYVDIAETESSLIIGSSLKEKRDITITLSRDNQKDIINLLTHLYRKGFDRIKIQGMDADSFKEIKKATKLLLGFDITEKSGNYCVIENISEPTDEKYEVMFRRVFLIVTETIDAISLGLRNGRFNSSAEIEEMKENHDKFILFCRRLLTREKQDRNLVLSWELLTFLMHIEHSLFYFYRFAADSNLKADAQIIDCLDELKDYFGLYRTAYYEKDIDSIHKINNLKSKHHFGTILQMIEKSSGKKAVAFSYLREVFRLIQIGSSPILSIILTD